MSYVEEHIYLGATTKFHFVRRPLDAVQPIENFIGFVERMEDGRRVKNSVGRWRNGKWDNGKGRDLSFEPTHFTELVAD